ncbi:hypothetical protein DXM27_16545 [Rhizobium rhizogenes]|uniref:Uncharacterized protein n=1 Tax=Rhizobium rhizogenes TaxID=359 RepID=A0AA88EZC9_RHIRH|nr:hypothetical protein [Rhizobium rhizogenes]KAA3500812.1 hypothetical protein DXM27_16545 [Rhizobium rhizogenes]
MARPALLLWHGGKVMTVAEISRALGVTPSAVYARRRGDTVPTNAELSAERTAYLKDRHPNATYFEFEGKRMSLLAWSRHLGINYSTMRWSLHHGKTFEQIVGRRARSGAVSGATLCG